MVTAVKRVFCLGAPATGTPPPRVSNLQTARSQYRCVADAVRETLTRLEARLHPSRISVYRPTRNRPISFRGALSQCQLCGHCSAAPWHDHGFLLFLGSLRKAVIGHFIPIAIKATFRFDGFQRS